jgi:CubicO group peptidase (beta-lactamase class C family)
MSLADYEAALDALPDELSGEYVAAPPNLVFSYSNLAYSLLRVSVARVSGQSYTGYVREHILQPLDFQTSFFDPHDDRAAKGYVDGVEVPMPLARGIPNGGLFSSVDDLANLVKMVFNNGTRSSRHILRGTSLDEMLTPQNQSVALDFGFRYGLGFSIEPPPEIAEAQVAGHGGDWTPFHAVLQTLPQFGLGIVVLTNS